MGGKATTMLVRVVRRKVPTRHHDARKYKTFMVALDPEPIPTIEIRAPRRSGYSITLDGLYDLLAVREAERRKADRRKNR